MKQPSPFWYSYFGKLINFFKSANHEEWMSFLGSMLGAIIGALVAVFVVWLQNKQQKDKDFSNEQNKMRYLHFLFEDSFRAVRSYDEGTQNLRRSFNNNPFVISDFPAYPAHSLNAIANKVNQEEYYLASINQFENGNISELLLICNTLYDNYKRAIEHFRGEFPKLIERKDKLKVSLEELREVVIQYLLSHNTTNSPIYNQIQQVQTNLVNVNSTATDANYLLFQTKAIYLEPLISIIEPHDQRLEERKVLLKVYDVLQQYDHMIGVSNNVVTYAEINRNEMEKMVTRIKVVGKPLNDYIIKLNSKN